MSAFLKGYIAGFFTIPFIVACLYAVWVFTWGQMFRKGPK